MTTWRMSLGPASITIRTDLAVGSLRNDLYELSQVRSVQDPTIDVELRDHGQAGMIIDPASGQVKLRATRSDLNAESLMYLSYLVLESRLQLHGIMTLHAAAVERDGQAVLLLGHPGAGKTTTAVRLCRDYGYKLLANDLAVVGGPRSPLVHAGTRNVTLRRSSVAGAIPELLGLFTSCSDDPWRAKIDIQPQDLGISTGKAESMVAFAVFVHSDQAYRSVLDLPADSLVHRLNLHENSLRYVRGGSTPWLIGSRQDFGPYVACLDTPAAHSARVRTLRRLIAISRYIAGPPCAVAEIITRRARATQRLYLGVTP